MNPTLFRRAGAVTLITAAAAALTGCAGGIGAQLTFEDVTKTKVSQILLDVGSGDVEVTAGPVTETRITRIVHSSTDPDPSFTLTGTQLRLTGNCGRHCDVSYKIEAPAGVTVTGELASGDVSLEGVAATDVRLSSGDIMVRNATGAVRAVATSGDITVIDSKGPATLVASSGDLHVINAGAPVNAKASSGDIDVKLSVPASVTAVASSGDVVVTVPQSSYRVNATAGSGDVNVTDVPDDPTAKNVLDVQASSGDVTVAALPAA